MSTEQRTNLKFLVRLGKTPTEALGLLQQVYGNGAMSKCWVFEWHKKFKEGREDVEDDPRSGRQSTSKSEENVERMRQKVRSDRRSTVRMIANELSMNSERVWTIHSPSDRALEEWKSSTSPRPKKARMSKSKVKVMLIAFFDVRGIVHKEFLLQGQTINQHIYKDILRPLMRSVREKRQELKGTIKGTRFTRL